jgi:hypothetical protein
MKGDAIPQSITTMMIDDALFSSAVVTAADVVVATTTIRHRPLQDGDVAIPPYDAAASAAARRVRGHLHRDLTPECPPGEDLRVAVSHPPAVTTTATTATTSSPPRGGRRRRRRTSVLPPLPLPPLPLLLAEDCAREEFRPDPEPHHLEATSAATSSRGTIVGGGPVAFAAAVVVVVIGLRLLRSHLPVVVVPAAEVRDDRRDARSGAMRVAVRCGHGVVVRAQRRPGDAVG